MSKFATATKTAVFSAVRSVTQTPDTVTHEGGAGYSRDPKSELFLLAVANMVAERSFYEDTTTRDARFEGLIAEVTKSDPGWIVRFIPYLRDTMNMRSASLVMALEYVRAGGPNGRQAVDSALRRADEPAEAIGYWLSHYGRHIPQPVKRGVADAVLRLYNEAAALKYDGDKGVRMGDVIEFVHPKPRTDWQAALFGYLIAKRHNRARLDVSALPMIAGRIALDAIAQGDRRARLAEGLPQGTTWEWASSWLGSSLDGAFWDALIPNMGIFALVRNLRNFDDAGISDASRDAVRAKLTDSEVIARSRMFPLRFYAAHKEVATTRWSEALDTAIEHSLANIPPLNGRTLVLVDVSGSMSGPMSGRSKLTRREAASIFGSALAMRAEKADLVAFGTTSWDVPFRKVGSVLRLAQELAARDGGGTDTAGAVRNHLRPEHDRVVILTDEQAHYSPEVGDKPLYTFNLAGYKVGHAPSGKNRHTFGGLSDAAFTALALLERGTDADWPF